MQAIIDFFKAGPDLYTIILGAVLGGIAWFVHRRSGDLKAGPPIIDLLEGAMAGVVALAVLQPSQLLAQVSTALVAGYSASSFLAKQAEVLTSKSKDDATTSMLQTADTVKRANKAVNQSAILNAFTAQTTLDQVAAAAQHDITDQAVDEIVTSYLDKIARAGTVNEVRSLQHQATLELKKLMKSAA